MSKTKKSFFSFENIIMLISVGLVFTLSVTSIYFFINNQHKFYINAIKVRADFEGREAYVSILENKNNPFAINIEDIASNKGKYKNINLNWNMSDNGKYLILEKGGFLDEISRTANNIFLRYEVYETLCSSIQSNNDYVEFNLLPQRKSYSELSQNLDCVYDNNEFKIVYKLDKEFFNLKD